MSKKILIVEDNPLLAGTLNYKLREEGYDVQLCCDGTTAITKIKLENYDLILIDLILPYTSGLKVIKWSKTEYPFLPIIVVSAITEVNIITHTYLLGVSDFISKPFNQKGFLELSSKIRSTLQSA